MFMSSMIQDYATLLQRYHAEHLIHASSGKAVAKACAEISRRSFQWADIMASLQKPSAKFSISLDQFDEDK
jgi:hypothetical protein